MTALWIALGVVGYLAVGTLGVRLFMRGRVIGLPEAAAMIWLWPVVYPLCLIMFLRRVTVSLARWAGAEIEDE